jgi:uncharacterized protein YybS (DUF2232 family)
MKKKRVKMDQIVEAITSNSIYLIIGGVLVIAFLFMLLKKLIKLAILILLLAIGYVGYLHYTGGDLPISTDDIKDKIEEIKDEVMD